MRMLRPWAPVPNGFFVGSSAPLFMNEPHRRVCLPPSPAMCHLGHGDSLLFREGESGTQRLVSIFKAVGGRSKENIPSRFLQKIT